MKYRIANSAVQDYFGGVRSPHRTVVRGGYGVDDSRPSLPDLYPLDERVDEGFGLGQFAGLEELAHLLCEGCYDVGAVEELPTLGQKRPCLLSGCLQLLLALAVFPDAVRGVGHLDVRRLYDAPYATQPPLHLLQLPLNGLQLLPLLPRHPVHLLVQQLHQSPDIGLCEDVLPHLLHDELLEFLRVESGGLASAAAALDQGVADVVGVPSALGL